ncbi:hypothetical protein V6N13_110433 [Hibiscus sabdariffa]
MIENLRKIIDKVDEPGSIRLLQLRNQSSMLLLLLCKCFDVLPKQDDKGDASNRDNESCLSRNLGGDSDLSRASCCDIGLSLSPIN